MPTHPSQRDRYWRQRALDLCVVGGCDAPSGGFSRCPMHRQTAAAYQLRKTGRAKRWQCSACRGALAVQWVFDREYLVCPACLVNHPAGGDDDPQTFQFQKRRAARQQASLQARKASE